MHVERSFNRMESQKTSHTLQNFEIMQTHETQNLEIKILQQNTCRQ